MTDPLGSNCGFFFFFTWRLVGDEIIARNFGAQSEKNVRLCAKVVLCKCCYLRIADRLFVQDAVVAPS